MGSIAAGRRSPLENFAMAKIIDGKLLILLLNVNIMDTKMTFRRYDSQSAQWDHGFLLGFSNLPFKIFDLIHRSVSIFHIAFDYDASSL